ncbi:MAG: DUF2487 family protein [Solibacillus sp.]
MHFNVKDLEQFQAQKQFIDTAIVPLVHIDLTMAGMQQSGSAVDYLLSLTNFIEQQFRGRIVLLPYFSYTTTSRDNEFPSKLEEELLESGFKTIIFISCDHYWQSFKDKLNIIWLPSIPLESMDKTVKQRILEDQLKQVVPVLTNAWNQ